MAPFACAGILGIEDKPLRLGPDTGDLVDGAAETTCNDAIVDGCRDIDAPWVPLEYDRCPPFVSCPSDPIGTWVIAGGCVRPEVFAAARKSCRDLVLHDVSFNARGAVVLDGKTLTSKMSVELGVTLEIPPTCATLGGGSCGPVATFLMTPSGGGFDSADCSPRQLDGGETVDAGPGLACTCVVHKLTTAAAAGPYTSTGNGTIQAGSSRLAYCATENRLAYDEQSPDQALPATIDFTRHNSER